MLWPRACRYIRSCGRLIRAIMAGVVAVNGPMNRGMEARSIGDATPSNVSFVVHIETGAANDCDVLYVVHTTHPRTVCLLTRTWCVWLALAEWMGRARW